MADVTLDISDKLGTLRDQIAKSVSKEVIEAIRKEKIPAGGGTETPRQVPPTKQNQNPTFYANMPKLSTKNTKKTL